MTTQMSFAWGRESRSIGKRKKPGLLYNLIQWFIRKTGRCWATFEYLAGKLNVSVRTLQRWWSEHASIWGVERRRTTGNTWEFFIAKVSPPDDQTVTPKPDGPLYESKEESVSPAAVKNEAVEVHKPTAPRGTHPFDVYFGIFVASGRALSEYDRMRAGQFWLSLEGKERDGWENAAQRDAIEVCRNASGPRFIPLPFNHLYAKPWTRVAMPRTLEPEGKLTRMMREAGEILRKKGLL